MSAARITILGDGAEFEGLEVVGRFTAEAEIDAFIAHLWRVWFVSQPDEQDSQEQAQRRECAEPPIESLPADFLGSRRHDADATDSGGKSDAAPADGVASLSARRVVGLADDADAFARLTPMQRRAVLLKRKLGGVAKVAKEMGVVETTVYQHLKAAREKGVAA